MKSICNLAAVVSALACTVADAANVHINRAAPDVYSIYLEGGFHNGQFDAVAFKAQPELGSEFTNQSNGLQAGIPRPAGQPFSYRNRFLDLDPEDPDTPGGLGWTVIGSVNTPSELSFLGGSLGATISTASQPGGRLFLANVNFPTESYGWVSVELYRTGVIVYQQMAPFVIPEPATFGLAGTAMLSLAAFRRGRWQSSRRTERAS